MARNASIFLLLSLALIQWVLITTATATATGTATTTTTSVRYNVENIAREDLAVSRLQDRARRVVSQVQEGTRDPARLASFKAKGGGLEVLKLFNEGLKNDIFALENQVDNSRLEALLQQIHSKHDKDPSETTSWSDMYEKLRKIVGKIDLSYGYLDGYFSNPGEATSVVLEDYARTVLHPGLSQEMSVSTTLANLHHLIIPNDQDGENELHDGRRGRQAELGGKKGVQRNDLFYKLNTILSNQDEESLCLIGQSPQQLLFTLYNLVALIETKGYLMIQFSYLILGLGNHGNYSVEMDKTNLNFDSQSAEKLLSIKRVLARTERDIWKCDPDRQIEGTTYIALKKLLQGHIENEADMNNLGSCKDSCSSYKIAERHSCYKNLLCAKQPTCNGRLFDCTFYHADAWVCMSQNNDRKYDWVEYEDGRVLGKMNQCISKIKVDSWWRWVFWHCSYCLCKCDEQGPDSDRYWSLKPSVSDTKNNKVVSGARFVKKNRVIHIEIEQSTPLPEGMIDESSRKWINAPDVDVSNVPSNDEYMVMSYENRAIDLDRLDAPPGHVITGLKLRSLGGHLNLEIQVTPISFSTGKLQNERSTWIGNDNTPATPEQRNQLQLIDPDIPTNFDGRSKIDSTHNQFMLFDTTSPNKDVMQTTIPFIDSQNVTPTQGTWISGAGLYHKGEIGFGGYVGILLKTYDSSRHLVPKRDPNAQSRNARKRL